MIAQGTHVYSGVRSYTLSTRIAGGGEGHIYEIAGLQGFVAKIYKPGKASPDRLAKLRVMLAYPPDNPTKSINHNSIAWPADLLYSDPGLRQFIGFLMPRIEALSSISDVYHVPTRKKRFPSFNWKYLITSSHNMASAISALHDKNYVVGDLNESNILVTDKALVSVIDADSFQVIDPLSRKTFRSIVGKEEFTAPELAGVAFAKIDRKPEHDRFALAVLIFMLLMEGRHPFDGIDRRPGEQPTYQKMIQDNWFVSAHLGKSNVITPPKGCPPFSMLPIRLQSLFIQCFEAGANDPSARPTAHDWAHDLKLCMSTLMICSVNPQHQFSHHLSLCPWCQRMKSLRLSDPFPPVVTKGKQVPLPSISNKATRPQRPHAAGPRVAALNIRTYPTNLAVLAAGPQPAVAARRYSSIMKLVAGLAVCLAIGAALFHFVHPLHSALGTPATVQHQNLSDADERKAYDLTNRLSSDIDSMGHKSIRPNRDSIQHIHDEAATAEYYAKAAIHENQDNHDAWTTLVDDYFLSADYEHLTQTLREAKLRYPNDSYYDSIESAMRRRIKPIF